MDEFEIKSGKFVAGIGEHTYQEVIDDFCNTDFIGIITFNISQSYSGNMISALKQACKKGAHATVITNIPKRFEKYYGDRYSNAARQVIRSYISVLRAEDYGMRIKAYFDFTNHAKIIMTENIVYIGSENYSDESKNNYESGVISRDKDFISHIKDEVFQEQTVKAIPYYEYNVAEAVAILQAASAFCEEARQKIYEAAFDEWADYETNFKPVPIYKSNDSGITAELLSRILEKFDSYEDALKSVQEVIEYYYEKYDEGVPEQVEDLEATYDSYKEDFESMRENISGLFEDIEQLAHYNYDDEVSRIVNEDYGMESFDENIEHYMELAMSEANSDLELLIESAEPTIKEILEDFTSMKNYYAKMHNELYQILRISREIDNT